MIQRMQTLWLVLGAALSVAGTQLSFFSGNRLNATTQVKEWVEFTATQNTWVLMVNVGIAVAALVAIFLFKDRKRQLLITLLVVLLSLLSMALYFNAKQGFAEANLDLGALLAFCQPLVLLLAARGIYRDEKLVKSADRLR
jgi:peptidoglycan/LPS O-acetylase OafA/YrhL